MAYELSVDTGAIVVPVKDEYGEVIGEFKFVPTDLDILKRYKTVSENFESIKFGEDENIEEVLKLSDFIREQFDILFNAPVSDGLFKKCSPLTPLKDGRFFFLAVMDGLGGLLDEVYKERKESLERVQKATEGYN